MPPTQTAEALASYTAAVTATAMAAATETKAASTASPTGVPTIKELPAGVIGTPTETPTTAYTTGGESNLGLYGVVAGGVVLVVLILVGVWRRKRKKTADLKA